MLSYTGKYYTDKLIARFRLEADVSEAVSWTETQWLEAIAKKRGAIFSGGRIDYQKAAEIVLTDFRSGAMGAITLETPDEWMV